MNLLTQVTLGEVLEFLGTLDDNTLLIPSWGRGIPSEEDPNRVCFARVTRGTVRTFRNVITRCIARPIQGNEYSYDTLVDVRNGPNFESLTLGMLIASVRHWKQIGEMRR